MSISKQSVLYRTNITGFRVNKYQRSKKIYLGTRTHSSKLFRPNWPSEPRPHEKICPLSFRASVWDAPHDTATIICASRATTCSNEWQRETCKGWLIFAGVITIKSIPNLVFFWTSHAPAVPGHCSHRCILYHHPAGRLCVCGRTPHHTHFSPERTHIFVAQPQSLRQYHPSLTVRRKHFPSTAL